MKTPIRATVAAALLTVLAGCASTQAASSPSSPVGNGGSASAGAPSDEASTSPGSTGDGTPTAPTPASPPTTAGGGGNGGAQVLLPPVHSTAANGDRITYVTPQGITVADGGRTLTTSVEWGGCQEQPQLVVFGQSAGQVVVEVKTVTHSRPGQMCPNIERVGTVKAALTAPLGERQVIDGVTGKAVSTAD